MSRYILIRRLRGPMFLLLVGIIALLNQADILPWHHAWPLFLILAGVMLLAERAALASEGYPPVPGIPYGGYPPTPGAAGPTSPQTPTPGTSIVPARESDFDSHGGQS